MVDHRWYTLKGAEWGSGARVFCLMYGLGLGENDDVLDFGAGGLRVGRYLIAHLERGHYKAIEPAEDVYASGIDNEVGTLAEIKAALARHNDDFNATIFGVRAHDWVLCSGVLTHMSHAQMRTTIRSSYQALRGGGRLIGTYLPDGPDHVGDDWQYPGQASHYRNCIEAILAEDTWTDYAEIDEHNGAIWWVATARHTD